MFSLLTLADRVLNTEDYWIYLEYRNAIHSRPLNVLRCMHYFSFAILNLLNKFPPGTKRLICAETPFKYNANKSWKY